jgi:hypothetical protein
LKESGTPAPGYGLQRITTQEIDTLYVQTNSASQRTAIAFDSYPGQQAMLNFMDSGVQKFQVGKQTDNTFFFWDQANLKNFLTVNPSTKVIAFDPQALPYNVGIGPASPTVMLDVVMRSVSGRRRHLHRRLTPVTKVKSAGTRASFTFVLQRTLGNAQR